MARSTTRDANWRSQKAQTGGGANVAKQAWDRLANLTRFRRTRRHSDSLSAQIEAPFCVLPTVCYEARRSPATSQASGYHAPDGAGWSGIVINASSKWNAWTLG